MIAEWVYGLIYSDGFERRRYGNDYMILALTKFSIANNYKRRLTENIKFFEHIYGRNPMNQTSLERKKAIELRLKNQGIVDYKIQYLPYLDFDAESFAKPLDVGCRIMILSAVSLAAQQAEHRAEIVNWLKREAIWEYVSPREMLLFEGEVNDQKTLIDFSWQIESAYVLAWSLGLVSKLSESCQPFSDSEYDDFAANVPLVGDDLKIFLSNLEYINKTMIIDENLFNELATTYFRDVYFNGSKNKSKLNKIVSFERHKALNWVRRFMEIEDWDDTDTST